MSRLTSPAPVVLWCLCGAATVMATHLLVAQDASRGTPLMSGEASGPCRTYDTSGTAVSVTGTSKLMTTFSGVYDPWTKRTTQKVTYNSGRGLSLTFTQVTTYGAADDVVAEVIRLKAPADASTNATGRPTPIVPPLSRFRQVVASGAVGFTLTNSFDANGRLTGSTHVRPSGRTLTRYTAWDGSGRPTAGTVESATQSSQVTIAYDDAARTSTITTNTGSLLITGTQTYDVNGNPRLYTQRSNLDTAVSTTTTTPTASASVCLGELRVPVAPTMAPADPSSTGRFTATINASAWNASLGFRGHYIAGGQQPIVLVGGRDSRYQVSVGFAAPPGPGDFTAGLMDPAKVDATTEAQFTEMIRRNTVVATVVDRTTQAGWQADPAHGSGTVRVMAVSASGASGTFALTLEPTPGTSASGTLTLSGNFAVQF
jgi:hypothetical protein